MSGVKDDVLRRHYLSMIRYLKENERSKSLHVTDLVYGCPRYARWIYEDRLAGKLDERNYNEKDLLVFVVGKKLDELVVGDYHHVKLRLDVDGVSLVGEIDDLIVDDNRIVIVDRKTVRQRPPKEAHSHYISQVNSYAFMLKNGCSIEGFDGGDEVQCRELEKRLKLLFKKGVKVYGSILYIDVSLESPWRISDVVDWEINEEALYQLGLDMLIEEFKKELPNPVFSWFCNVCPFFVKCMEVGFG